MEPQATALTPLSRRSICLEVGDTIGLGRVTLRVERVHRGKAFLGVSAPADVPVHREEVWEAIQREIAKH